MLVDTHVHVGQFFDLYFAPSDIHNLMEQLQVRYYAVSSTSMCEENYTKVLDQLHKLIELDGDKVLPTMWITPGGLQGNIAWFLESDIKWRMIKIHPYLESDAWQKNPLLFDEVINIARDMNLPLMIHTGNEACCQCNLFENNIANNPDVVFILAHGRPIRQAIRMAQDYANAFIDSAFMPINDMARFTSRGLEQKLLWGTDMCIPKHFYPNQDMQIYYSEKLEVFKKSCTLPQFEHITFLNAVKLFKL